MDQHKDLRCNVGNICLQSTFSNSKITHSEATIIKKNNVLEDIVREITTRSLRHLLTVNVITLLSNGRRSTSESSVLELSTENMSDDKVVRC